MADSSRGPDNDNPVAAVKRSARTVAAWFWANVTIGAFGVWVVGEVLRDRNVVTGACFLVPSAFLSLVLLVAALLAFACGCRRIAVAAALAWCFPTFWVLFVENQWLRPAPRGEPERALRLVHWNIGPVADRWEAVVERLRPLEADACVLSECFTGETSARIAAALGKDFKVCHVRQIAVIARGALELARPDERMPSRLYMVEWKSKVGPLVLMVVDLPSRPLFSRAPWLQQVHDRIAFLKPDMVVGDFNARRRAHWLGNLPRGYEHAYNAAGAGWCYSWPDGFPLWDIDQCILGPRIRPIRYDITPTGVSDHRLQVFDFSLAPSR